MKNIISSFTLKILGIVLSFITSVLIARYLGVDLFGSYTLLLSWVNILVVVSLFGQEELILKQAAISGIKKSRMPDKLTMIISVVIMTFFLLLKHRFNYEIEIVQIFLISAIIVFLALNRIRQSFLRGVGQQFQSYLSDSLVYPLTIILFLTIINKFEILEFRLEIVLLIIVIASVFAVSTSSVFLNRTITSKNEKNTHVSYFKRIKEAKYFLLLSLSGILFMNMNILVLGTILEPKYTGIYVAADRIAAILGLFLFVSNTFLAPRIAKSYNQGNTLQKRASILYVVRLVFLVSILLYIFLYLTGNKILSLYGTEFINGYNALMILCASQIVNVSFGPVGYVLSMTGREKIVLVVTIISIILLSSISLILAPLYGVMGAAISMLISMTFYNLSLSVFSYKALGFDVSILGVKL